MTNVSVIMAVRNSEDYVSQSIESVLNQTYKKFEFIIVDDCSNDKTQDILRSYQKNDKRIKIVKNKIKLGPAASRNIAINLSKGRWISIIDSDDIFFPKKIEAQLNFVNKNKETIFVGSSLLFINENGSHIAYYKYKNNFKKIKSEILKNKSFPPHSSYFINKKYLKKISGYNSRFSMAPDYDLLLRLQNFKKKNFAVCAEILTKVRLHSRNRSLKKINNYTQLDYAILANICFHINKTLNINPAEILNDKDWDKFKIIFKNFLIQSNYYKFLVKKLKFKKEKKITEYLKYFLNLNFIRSLFIGHILPKSSRNEFILIYKKSFLRSK